MRTQLQVLAFWLLALTTIVAANPFWFREETSALSASATAAPSSKAAEASASTTGTAPPAATTGADETAAASNATSNATAAATSSAGAAATSSVYLDDTPEDLRCHVDRKDKPEEDVSPFCKPTEGQIVTVGEKYDVTWDPTLFAHNSTIKVSLKYANDTNRNDTWSRAGVANERGYVSLLIHADYGPNATELTLFITSEDPAGEPKSGPVITMVDLASNSTSSHSGSSSGKELGEKAGIPVGLGIFLIAAAGLAFWWFRRRRGRQAGYMAKRGATTARMTGDESGVGGGFRDEPTRGLELQDRAGGGNGGRGRQDSWEAGWDTSSSQGGSGGGGGGNAFRDEIDRQRRR